MFHREPSRRRMTAEKKNKGFSLVEVLVSMLILAIIIAPILGNIVRASQANSKSRKMQDASTLGQNIMEGIKSQESFEEVAKQLIYKDNGVDFKLFSLDNLSGVVTKQLDYDSATLTFAEALTPCVTRAVNHATGDYDYTLSENSSRKYHFEVSDITYNGMKYCALVTYDGSVYSKADPLDPDDKYNDIDIPVLPSVSDKSNAVITVKYQDEWAASTLKVLYNKYFNSTMTGDNTVTNEDIANDMNRTFFIDLSYDSAKGKYIVSAKFIYELTNLIPVTATGFTRHYEDTFYKQEFDQLENVYLFFSPNLKKRADEINLNNQLTGDAADLNVYFVEQKEGSDAAYENLMNQYWLTVNLTEAEPPRDPLTNEYIYHTAFRTNLGSTIAGFDGNSRIIYSGLDVNKLNHDELLEWEKDKTRIYNITVDLYYEPESGTDMFKDSDHIMTFTSSKGE